jgi:RNA polymerase sigma-70 factor (ECF subfamily)
LPPDTPPGPPGTTQLRGWLERLKEGDQAAREALLRAFGVQLESLARKMLRRFPSVARWEQTGDVLQNALVRLMRALPEVMPGSVAGFVGLAAQQMRRELLDLARHYRGPLGHGANHASWPSGPEPAGGDDQEDLERWAAFHEGVASLPEDQRQAVDLLFYHGLEQAEAAELLGVSVRTLQRRWQGALVTLEGRLR